MITKAELADRVLQQCLARAGDDVEAAFAAADRIVALYPSLAEAMFSTDEQGNEHRGKGERGGQFVSKTNAFPASWHSSEVILNIAKDIEGVIIGGAAYSIYTGIPSKDLDIITKVEEGEESDYFDGGVRIQKISPDGFKAGNKHISIDLNDTQSINGVTVLSPTALLDSTKASDKYAVEKAAALIDSLDLDRETVRKLKTATGRNNFMEGWHKVYGGNVDENFEEWRKILRKKSVEPQFPDFEVSALFANFDPNQPRKPRGDPEGGEWVTVGGYVHPATKMHIGGFHVKVGRDGTILNGKLRGKNLRAVKEHFDNLPTEDHQRKFVEAVHSEPAPQTKPELGSGKDKVDDAEQQYKKLGTRSPTFKSWFGDWEKDPDNASKVVDKETGEPKETGGGKRVFHGTKVKFDSFDKSKAASSLVGKGFYFAEDRRVSETFASKDGGVLECYLNIRNPFDCDSDISREDADKLAGLLLKRGLKSIPPEYKSAGMTEQMQLDDFKSKFKSFKDKAGDKINAWEVYKHLSYFVGDDYDLNDVFADAGYDGITHEASDAYGTVAKNDPLFDKGSSYGRCWIAFEPNQIKSTKNKGTFDSKSSNINLSIVFGHDVRDPAAQAVLDQAVRASRKISSAARKDLAEALDSPNRSEAVQRFIDKYRLQLARLLSTTQLTAILEGAQEVAAKVPPLGTVPVEGLPVAEQERIAALQPPEPPPPFEPPAPLPGDLGAVYYPTISRAVKNLAERNVMTRDQYDELDAAARAKAFTVAGVQAEETLAKIRDTLAENVREGADYASFKQEVLEAVEQGTFLSDAHQETVFRTNVQSAFSAGQAAVLSHPLVRSGFPYSTYDAIHDDRVRHNHLALETHGIAGTNVYRNDDPVFQMFRPPWDYNDRCGWTPITVRQAAERGVPEAQEWLRTGIEPSPKAHVEVPPFSPPEGFQRDLAAPFSTDRSGREHRGKGERGGQFTSKNNTDTFPYKIEKDGKTFISTGKTGTNNKTGNHAEEYESEDGDVLWIHTGQLEEFGQKTEKPSKPKPKVGERAKPKLKVGEQVNPATIDEMDRRYESIGKGLLDLSSVKDKSIHLLDSMSKEQRAEVMGYTEYHGYELKKIPLSKIRPSQKGEDRINDSSRHSAATIASGKLSKIAKADVAPIVVTSSGSQYDIVDGNHRFTAAEMNGQEYIYAWVGPNTGKGLSLEKVRLALASAPLSIRLSLQPMSTFSTDSSGRKHRGKGKGGGQFVSKSGTSSVESALDKTYESDEEFLKDWSENPEIWVEYRAWATQRGGQTKDDEFSQEVQDRLDHVATTSPKYSGKLYRGMVGITDEALAEMEPGEILKMPGWVSTSKKEDIANNFTNQEEAEEGAGVEFEGDNTVLVEIDQDGSDNIDMHKMGINEDQEEVMFPGHKLKLRITNREVLPDGTVKLHASVVDSQPKQAQPQPAKSPRAGRKTAPKPALQPVPQSDSSTPGSDTHRGFKLIKGMGAVRIIDSNGSVVHRHVGDMESAKQWVDGLFSMFSVDSSGRESLELVADIIVLLFGEDAENAAEYLCGDSAALGIEAAFGPKVTRRYGRRPGPQWRSGGVSARGQQIWLHPSHVAPVAPPVPTPPPVPPPQTTTTAPTPPAPPPVPPPIPPVAPPAPPPPHLASWTPAPVPVLPPGARGGPVAKVNSTLAYNAAMAKLASGQPLTQADKVSLAGKLTNMPVNLLRSLHTALGGSAAVANQRAIIASVKNILTPGAAPTPPPAPVTVPQPAPTSSAPSSSLSNLPSNLHGPAAMIRAITLAQADGLISIFSAKSEIESITQSLSPSDEDALANAFGINTAFVSADASDYIKAINFLDPGHIGPSPPGPPPRPNLTWNATTHRWVLGMPGPAASRPTPAATASNPPVPPPVAPPPTAISSQQLKATRQSIDGYFADMKGGKKFSQADIDDFGDLLNRLDQEDIDSIYEAMTGNKSIGQKQQAVDTLKQIASVSGIGSPFRFHRPEIEWKKLKLLPPHIRDVAGQVRAIAHAANDGLMTTTDANAEISNLIFGPTMSLADRVQMAQAFETPTVKASGTFLDYIGAVASSDPGPVGSSPPGPPPRPGLVWNPTTHRWILAPTAAVPPPPVAVAPTVAVPLSRATGYHKLTQAQRDSLDKLRLGSVISQSELSDLESGIKSQLDKSQIVEMSKELGGPDLSSYWLTKRAAVKLVEFLDKKNKPGTTGGTTGPRLVSTKWTGAADTVWETGKPQPGTLNGVAFGSAPPKFWEKTKDVNVGEPPALPSRPVTRASIMIQEPDGRVWIVEPTNQFGNRKHTLPGGTNEPGLTDQQNALKEVWEETGLQVEITGYAGDFEDSNNGKIGRLYIGKRVGGAPWDAKIESHIIDQRTGKPSAESSHVHLVTPEKAAELLHRSDDLAQLMVVNPIKIDQPVSGKGSEPLKKFVAAIAPAVEAYKAKKSAKQEYHGNAELHVVQNLRGFNDKPTVVDKKDMDSLIAQGGHIEMLRGLGDTYSNGHKTGKELADQFRSGDNFPGHGIFGSGTYADSNKGYSNVANGSYSSGSTGAVVRIALPKTAKIITVEELEKMVPQAPKDFVGYAGGAGKHRDECWLGVQAALAGYDAIYHDPNTYSRSHGGAGGHGSYGHGFYVILNRSILKVQKEDAKGHMIK